MKKYKEFVATITIHFQVTVDSEIAKKGFTKREKAEIAKSISTALLLDSRYEKVEVGELKEVGVK